jgi:hypothetical protein
LAARDPAEIVLQFGRDSRPADPGAPMNVPMTVLRDARCALNDVGASVMTHVDLSRCLRIAGAEWDCLAGRWDNLVPDPYAAELGTTRLRRCDTASS